MKKQIHATLAKSDLMIALTLCESAISANAQSYKHITAKIPFDFTVGDKTLTACAYSIRQPDVNDHYLLSVRGEDRQAIANGFTNAIQANKAAAQTKLVFHKYGDRYFLSEILFEGDDTGRQFLKSHAERELTRKMARNSSRPEMAPIVVTNQP
jgi:hypothetical protein